MRFIPDFEQPSKAASWLRSAALVVACSFAGWAGAQPTAPKAPAPPAAKTAAVPAPAAPASSAADAVNAALAMSPSPALVKVPDGRLLAPDIARIVTRGELVVAMLGVDTPPFFS
jgi:polar amino acid transport system substrate-binding protein